MTFAIAIISIITTFITSTASAQIVPGPVQQWLSPERFDAFTVMNDTEILRHVNSLRSDPQRWGILVDSLIDLYRSGRPPRMLQHLLGSEGASLLIEVRNFLDTVTPVRSLRIRQCLRRVASLHARDVARHPGQIQHTSSNGNTLTQRVLSECPDAAMFGECIDHLTASPSTVVLRLLFDPDFPGRGHRYTLFDQDYAAVGIGGAPCRDHPILGDGYVVVLTFAND